MGGRFAFFEWSKRNAAPLVEFVRLQRLLYCNFSISRGNRQGMLCRSGSHTRHPGATAVGIGILTCLWREYVVRNSKCIEMMFF